MNVRTKPKGKNKSKAVTPWDEMLTCWIGSRVVICVRRPSSSNCRKRDTGGNSHSYGDERDSKHLFWFRPCGACDDPFRYPSVADNSKNPATTNTNQFIFFCSPLFQFYYRELRFLWELQQSFRCCTDWIKRPAWFSDLRREFCLYGFSFLYIIPYFSCQRVFLFLCPAFHRLKWKVYFHFEGDKVDFRF